MASIQRNPKIRSDKRPTFWPMRSTFCPFDETMDRFSLSTNEKVKRSFQQGKLSFLSIRHDLFHLPFLSSFSLQKRERACCSTTTSTGPRAPVWLRTIPAAPGPSLWVRTRLRNKPAEAAAAGERVSRKAHPRSPGRSGPFAFATGSQSGGSSRFTSSASPLVRPLRYGLIDPRLVLGR